MSFDDDFKFKNFAGAGYRDASVKHDQWGQGAIRKAVIDTSNGLALVHQQGDLGRVIDLGKNEVVQAYSTGEYDVLSELFWTPVSGQSHSVGRIIDNMHFIQSPDKIVLVPVIWPKRVIFKHKTKPARVSFAFKNPFDTAQGAPGASNPNDIHFKEVGARTYTTSWGIYKGLWIKLKSVTKAVFSHKSVVKGLNFRDALTYKTSPFLAPGGGQWKGFEYAPLAGGAWEPKKYWSGGSSLADAMTMHVGNSADGKAAFNSGGATSLFTNHHRYFFLYGDSATNSTAANLFTEFEGSIGQPLHGFYRTSDGVLYTDQTCTTRRIPDQVASGYTANLTPNSVVMGAVQYYNFPGGTPTNQVINEAPVAYAMALRSDAYVFNGVYSVWNTNANSAPGYSPDTALICDNRGVVWKVWGTRQNITNGVIVTGVAFKIKAQLYNAAQLPTMTIDSVPVEPAYSLFSPVRDIYSETLPPNSVLLDLTGNAVNTLPIITNAQGNAVFVYLYAGYPTDPQGWINSNAHACFAGDEYVNRMDFYSRITVSGQGSLVSGNVGSGITTVNTTGSNYQNTSGDYEVWNTAYFDQYNGSSGVTLKLGIKKLYEVTDGSYTDGNGVTHSYTASTLRTITVRGFDSLTDADTFTPYVVTISESFDQLGNQTSGQINYPGGSISWASGERSHHYFGLVGLRYLDNMQFSPTNAVAVFAFGYEHWVSEATPQLPNAGHWEMTSPRALRKLFWFDGEITAASKPAGTYNIHNPKTGVTYNLPYFGQFI